MTNKLLKMKEVAYQFIHLQVQNGESCRFWSDNWSPYGKLHDYLDAGRSQLGIPKNATLASLQRNGSWQLPAARTKRQLQVLSYITTVQFNEEPDYYEWEISGEISNKYSTGDIYHFMRGTVEEAEWTKAIWTPGSITRQSFHAWLVALNWIPTHDRLLNWGLQVPSLCLICNSVDETRDHLFWDCGYLYALWSQGASRCRITPIRRWEDSIEQMTTLSSPTTARSLTLLGWQATLYWIWNERNQRLHANQFRSVDSLFTIVDHQIRNKIQSFRGTNPTQSSGMMQLWIR